MKKIYFLGTGASTGIPVISCQCKTCRSKSRFNKRLRSSVLINEKNVNVLIDVGPDFRQQALKYQINRLDALILTHAHFDHIAGIDDLRVYSRIQETPIKVFLLKETYDEVKIKCSHLFKKNKKAHTQSARLDFQILDSNKRSFKFKDITFNYFSFFQNSKKVLGIRRDNFAYITDIKRYDENIFADLQNLDVLILSCLKKEKSSLHFSLDDAINFAKKTNPKITYLTHIAHEIEHASFSKKLIKNLKLAYDGLIIKI